MRIAAIDKEVRAGLTERGIGPQFGKRNRIVDTGLNSPGIEMSRERVTPLGAHDKQMIDLFRPVLAHRKGQRRNFLQAIEVVVGDPDAMLGPTIKVAEL